MANPGRPTPTGPLWAPRVVASIVRDAVAVQREASKERGTTRIDEAGQLALLRDADALDRMGGDS